MKIKKISLSLRYILIPITRIKHRIIKFQYRNEWWTIKLTLQSVAICNSTECLNI